MYLEGKSPPNPDHNLRNTHIIRRVYADLDTECLRPTDSMFEIYNMTTYPHKSIPSIGQSTSMTSDRKAFLGRMGSDEGFIHSIPNAWMASTPGHPFWLLPLEAITESPGSQAFPEELTGPIALYRQVKRYEAQFSNANGHRLDQHYAQSPWRDLFQHVGARAPQSLAVLPSWEVYPYSWDRDGQLVRDVCWVSQPTFDAKRCKSLLAVDHWGSHAITYWSHSWSAEQGKAHSEEKMKSIS